MEADFSGYATKAGLRCSDGKTIMPGAFKHQDKQRVPLVWQHGHNDPSNVLGHALLEHREDGVYAHGFFNGTPKAQHAKELLIHEDINMMSIWANDLVMKAGRVMHGAIREVSLVLSGANPGALIEHVSIRHSDGDEVLDDEAIIYTGIPLEHATADDDPKEDEEEGDEEEGETDETIRDVYDSMTPKQQQVLHYMLAQALSDTEQDEEVTQDNMDSDKEGTTMTHNVFEKDGKPEGHTLSHEATKGIFADAMRTGSLREALNQYAISHGIENLELLFPEARALTTTPEWDKRRTEWVAGVLGGANKTPFSRVKSWTADITYDEARAKGYITGNEKKEEFFSISRRITTPQTIYKKQKLDRDDIIDIADFDVVAWMRGEMRLMLDEELARAVLVGDGRDIADEDKIQETNIRPIAGDAPYYTIQVGVDISGSGKSVVDAIDAITLARQHYKGSGTPNFYTTESFIARALTVRDGDGHRLYRTLGDLAAEMRVGSVIPVEVLEGENIVGILVNMSDYTIGADRGGQVTMFDDFDIDYNQYKYLIETRVSGALTKPKSAIVVRSVGTLATQVEPQAPTQNKTTGAVTIPDVEGVEYRDQDGQVLTAGEKALAKGDTLRVNAVAETGKYFPADAKTQWSFIRPDA
jgi:HK97 family phage prohead protease